MRIIPNEGICYPHAHVFNSKVFLYTTYDRGPGNPIYRNDDWQVFSSDDLLNWKLEYVLRPEDTFIGKWEECYATDAAERNGKYYLYFSQQQYCTGVAVADRPEGPYKDALGKPLLPPGLVDTASYDPTVFIDDDETRTPYIIFGYTVIGKQYYIARLNEDMISLFEPPRPIEIMNGWKNDANWIHKRNGVYYLNSHGGVYATSDNVYGPYTYHDALVDHGTFFTYHNQLYFTYAVPENWGAEKVDFFYRTAKIIYAHYKDNGDICIDEFIQDAGVGQYYAAWPAIKGEWYFAASDGVYKKENADGFEMRGLGEDPTCTIRTSTICARTPNCSFAVSADRDFARSRFGREVISVLFWAATRFSPTERTSVNTRSPCLTHTALIVSASCSAGRGRISLPLTISALNR